MYKNNKPINPLGQIKTARSELSGKDKENFLKASNEAKKEMESFLKNTDLTNTAYAILKEPIHAPSKEENEDEEVELELNTGDE